MARYYGALMLLAFIDFGMNNTDGQPSLFEKWMFRQWHFPQLYLAGLPLDFLDRPQLRWIIHALHELWKKGETSSELYDGLTDLLAFFGLLVRERRQADRNQKPKARLVTVGDQKQLAEGNADLNEVRGIAESTGIVNEEAAADGPVMLTSKQCPCCGEDLDWPQDSKPLGNGRVRASFFCSNCEGVRTYEVDVNNFKA